MDIMKQCNADKDYTNIDKAIREEITPYLYNEGEGKYVHVTEIARVRNCIRNNTSITQPQSKTERNASRSKLEKGKIGIF